MAQGIIGGATSYEEQSLSDIKVDVDRWVCEARSMKEFISNQRRALVSGDRWNSISYDFQSVILSTERICETFAGDLEIVSTAIAERRVGSKEVALLAKVGTNSVRKNLEYGQAFKNDDRWKAYSESWFQKVERIYKEGRDFFVTLQDAENAAGRLRDYVEDVHMHNEINIGGDVVGSNIQQGDCNAATAKLALADLEKLLDALSDAATASLSEEQAKQVAGSIDDLRSEAKSPNPNKPFVKTLLTGLRHLGGSAEFVAAVLSIAQYFSIVLG